VRGTGYTARAGDTMTTTATGSTVELFWLTMLAVVTVVFNEIVKNGSF
jgi:hypothetical protein